MIEGTAIKEIRFKNGYIIHKGSPLTLRWPDPQARPMEVEVQHQQTHFKGDARTSLAWMGLSASLEMLIEATEGDVCETPGGNTVEPDGVDESGIPSWLKIHGLV